MGRRSPLKIAFLSLDRWVPAGLWDQSGAAQTRAKLTVMLAIVSMAVTILNMSARLVVGDWTAPEFWILGLSVAVWSTVPPLVRYSKDGVAGAAVLLISAILSIGSVSFLQGGLHSPVLVWTMLVPVVSALLFQGPIAPIAAAALISLVWIFFGMEKVPDLLHIPWAEPADASYQIALNYTVLVFLGTVTAWGFRWQAVRSASTLAQAEEAMRALAEAGGVGLVVVDEGEIVFRNPAAEEVLDWRTRDEVRLRDLLCLPSPPPEVVLQSPGVEPRSYAVQATPIHFNKRAGVLFSLVDQTDEQRAGQERLAYQRRLQEDQRMESLGLLAGGVAHDFNNLLTPILGNVALLSETLEVDPASREALEDVRQAATQASELVRQILAYAGRAEVIVQPQDLSGLTGVVVRLVRSGIKSGAQLELTLADALPPVLADAAQLKQVVANLVTNAMQAAGETGRVEVRTEVRAFSAEEMNQSCLPERSTPGRYVVISVRDTGPGIPAALRQRIFDPFFTTRQVGRGLGLASVLGIVRKLGGDILLQSSPGDTHFQVLLRPSAGGGTVTQGGALARQHARPGTVLLVDDEPLVRGQLYRVLHRRGWRVLLAESGTSALDLYRAHRAEIDLLIVDFLMPGMNGAELLTRLKVLGLTQPVVLCTGFAPENSDLDGFSGVLRKPFTLDELDEVIAAAQVPAQ
ncbi:MAG: response regulator [Deltaproteobacteria bacterium]|nr:response regulator [Deltaproteobacteria bacterium]